MKKIMMAFVFVVSYTSFTPGNATAQGAINNAAGAPKTEINTNSGDDYFINANGTIDPVDKKTVKEMEASLHLAKATVKISNHLRKNFNNVSGLSWNSEEKLIIATFKMNEKSARVVYDKKGGWLYSVITYSEDLMPQDVRELVKSNYSGFSISLVQEINEGPVTLFKVFLEDCTSLKHILVCNGDITVYGDYVKGN